MSLVNQLDIIWLKELDLAIIYPDPALSESYAAAAIVIKGEDGTDAFIPYDGFSARAPIAFPSLGQNNNNNNLLISVLGFADSGEPTELAVFHLNEKLTPGTDADGDLDERALLHVIGFGESAFSAPLLSENARNPSLPENTLPEAAGAQNSASGICALDYEIDGRVDYGELLAAFVEDARAMKSESFTGLYVTAVPRRAGEVGPAIHLKPLGQFHFGLGLDSPLIQLEDHASEMIDHETGDTSPFDETAFMRRYKPGGTDDAGYGAVRVPEFSLFAGTSREAVDFLLASGFVVHWRRQMEVWNQRQVPFSPFDETPGAPSFSMLPFLERDHLLHNEDGYFLNWAIEGVVFGDVIGFVCGGEHISVSVEVPQPGGERYIAGKNCLFVFMGDEFLPLSDDIWRMSENQVLIKLLEGYIDQGLNGALQQNVLDSERRELATSLFQRDHDFSALLGDAGRGAIAAEKPFGPELMVYRDHMLRLASLEGSAGWLADVMKPLQNRQPRLVDTLRYENFSKTPQLMHMLVFNKSFRDQFLSKPKPKPNKTVLEYVLSNLFSERLIEWALRLKGESQAILWHLALKRPHMVERLYELKMEPDTALNPYDDKSLDHAEAALSESSQIDAEVLEHKVLPILRTLGEDQLLYAVEDYVVGLSHGGDRRKLNIGALSICLGAVERAEACWQNWEKEAGDVFGALIAPLNLSFPAFDGDADFAPSLKTNERRRDISHLVQRLGADKGLDEAGLVDARRFIEGIEAGVLLDEIQHKLDLALKYHHDLSVGRGVLHERFNCDEAMIDWLEGIAPEEWPHLEMFGPTFSEPIQRRQLAMQDEFDNEVFEFAQGVHPDDPLFLESFRNSLSALEQVLNRLVWMETGAALEDRLAGAQAALSDLLAEGSAAATKLRRSKALRRAVRQVIVAERMGPAGWQQMQQNLDQIEQRLASKS